MGLYSTHTHRSTVFSDKSGRAAVLVDVRMFCLSLGSGWTPPLSRYSHTLVKSEPYRWFFPRRLFLYTFHCALLMSVLGAGSMPFFCLAHTCGMCCLPWLCGNPSSCNDSDLPPTSHEYVSWTGIIEWKYAVFNIFFLSLSFFCKG